MSEMLESSYVVERKNRSTETPYIRCRYTHRIVAIGTISDTVHSCCQEERIEGIVGKN